MTATPATNTHTHSNAIFFMALLLSSRLGVEPVRDESVIGAADLLEQPAAPAGEDH